MSTEPERRCLELLNGRKTARFLRETFRPVGFEVYWTTLNHAPSVPSRCQMYLINRVGPIFLCLLILGSHALNTALAAAEPEPPERPNFVFLYTDDQRWDC